MKYYLKKYSIIVLGVLVLSILLFIIKLLNLPTTIFLILSIFMILTFVKICKDYLQYGSKIFKFKTTLNYNEMELIAKDIEKLDIYQKIIVKDNRIIVINKAGVFEFILFNQKGYLKGNVKEKDWYLDDVKIENPFSIESEYKYNYFIVNGVCLFKTDAKLVTKSNIYHEICKYLNKQIYDNKTVDEIYEVFNGYNKN